MRILMYNMSRRCIEAVITSLTRNQVVTFSWHESSNLFASVKFKKLPLTELFYFPHILGRYSVFRMYITHIYYREEYPF